MRIHSDFTRFAGATDAEQVVLRLGPQLSRLFGGRPFDDLRVARVTPRKHGGYTIQYRIDSEPGTPPYLCGHLLGDGEPVPSYAERDNPAVIRDDELGLVMPIFPFDPRLAALSFVCSPEGAAEMLADDGDATATVLAYRLEKRCVVRCELVSGGAKNRVVAKVVPRSRLQKFVSGHQQLHEAMDVAGPDTDLTIPRILRVVGDRGAYVMEEVPGPSLYAIVDADHAVTAYAAAGRAMRRFHGLPRPVDRLRTGVDELAQLDAWIARIAPMFPDVAAVFIDCQLRIRDAAGSVVTSGAPTSLVHGDFYDKQVHHAPGRTTVLDTDNLTGGDATQDLGNFSAHVRLRQLQDPGRAAALSSCLHAFEEAYGARTQDAARRINWWRSATLLRLAGLYALRPRWRHLVPALLEEVDSCIRSGAIVR